MLTTDGSPWSGDDARILGVPIRWTSVPDELPGGRPLPRARSGRMIATQDTVLFDGAEVRLLVRAADEVLIEPLGGRSRADVAHYAYGFAARVILLHRGRFALHGTAVDTPTGVVVLAGDSGAGKSTTALALTQDDGRILVDDVAPLRLRGPDVLVDPFTRPVHLLADSVLRVRPDRLAPVDRCYVAGPEGKTVYGLTVPVDQAPRRVRCLVVLEAVPSHGARPTASALRGAQRLQWIVRLSNVVGVSSFGSRREAYFRWAAQVADAVGMWQVIRDPQVDCVPAVAGVVQGLLDAAGPGTMPFDHVATEPADVG